MVSKFKIERILKISLQQFTRENNNHSVGAIVLDWTKMFLSVFPSKYFH